MSSNVPRGRIHSRKRAVQQYTFENLVYGPNKNITGTDIEMFYELRDKLFVFGEGKCAGVKMPQGQRTALENLSLACHNPPHRQAFVLVATHNTPADSIEDIDFASLILTEYHHNGQWHDTKTTTTVRDAMDWLIRAYVPELLL